MKSLIKRVIAALSRAGIWTLKKSWSGGKATFSWLHEKAADTADWVIDDALPAAGNIALAPFRAMGAAVGALVNPLTGGGSGGGGGVGPQTAAALNAAADQAKAAARAPSALDAEAAPPSPGRVIRSVAGHLVNGRAIPDRLLEAMRPAHSDWISGLEPDEIERLSRLEPSKILAILRGEQVYGVPGPAEVEARNEERARAAEAAASRLGQRVQGYRNARQVEDWKFNREMAANGE